ncbi:uncharacterized protein LOC121781285 [Salvia splendens]|uniref:uncharacterized protein LOC121781285 n=1 Tax=Salvia splendens TaxID=180675 RepID=UPI001C277D75|nr:uncharacterized protein LOC121781285 [Salvia splendens]
MAANSDKNRRLHWTNQKHLHFLNSMEASFVQSMLQNNSRFPPLHRYLPDSSDSTLDLDKFKSSSSTFHTDNVESSVRRTETKTKTKTIILSCQKSSQDQVVPEFQKQGR